MPLRKPKLEPGTALLVDGDNVPPDVLPAIIHHLEEEQPVTERRIYRNWRSTKDSQTWDRISKEGAFERVDRYNTRREGKNASDIAVSIGAMDLFYQGYRSFCLVSGDTDFVPLIERLRRGGASVMLIGHIEDPGLLEQISDSYTPHGHFDGGARPRRGRRPARRGGSRGQAAQPAGKAPPAQKSAPEGRTAKKPRGRGRKPARQGDARDASQDQGSQGKGSQRKGPPGKESQGKAASGRRRPAGPSADQKQRLEAFMQDVFDTATEEGRADDEGWILVDTLGKLLKQKDKGFQPSKYGYANRTSLSDLFQSCRDSFVVHSRPAKGGNRLVYRVRRR